MPPQYRTVLGGIARFAESLISQPSETDAEVGPHHRVQCVSLPLPRQTRGLAKMQRIRPRHVFDQITPKQSLVDEVACAETEMYCPDQERGEPIARTHAHT